MERVAFGKYELIERIAAGGMAEVFLARSVGLAGFERRLVIKRIRDEHAHDPRFVQSFVNEARIGVHLNHPNIVQVYELGRVGDAWFIAMEHLHGRDLSRLRKAVGARELGRLPQAVAVKMVADVLRALAYAHGRTDAGGAPLGLVHRDVSPHNVVVTFTGEVKLVDFGIARLMLAGAGDDTAGPVGGGKYAYMSPEQARGEPLDHRSDLFSAGIVLWELLVGRRLFQHTDPLEKLRRVQRAEIPHPADLGVDVPPDLWSILAKGLSADRDQRHATAADFEEDLRAWLFASRERVERHHVAEVLREAFPDEASRNTDDLHLHRLMADLERMELRGAPESVTLPSDPDGPQTKLPAPVGERRSVVVSIVDVDGLTDLSVDLSPEALFAQKLRLLRWVRSVVDSHGGTIQASVDDHITLMFGVPRSRNDDLRRAVACALQLVRDVGQLRARGLAVELCVGVHLGEVTVSNVGRRVRYVARGDTTRLARRLSAVADHGQVLVSERVVEALEGEFDLKRGPEVPSRAGASHRPSWAVQRRRAGLRGSGRGGWVRRADELVGVRRALMTLLEGRGSAVVVTGDSGMGKTRLLRELRDLAAARGIPFYGVHCTGQGSERPLEPLRDLLVHVLGEQLDAPVARLVAGLAAFADDLAPRDLDALRWLLGATVHPIPERGEVWVALADLLEEQDRPLIVALDDVHHLTEHSAHALGRWLARLRHAPVWVLLGHPPPLPEALDHLPLVTLVPLQPPQVRELAQQILGTSTVSERLVRLLEDSCEGSPLFVVEMLKYLQGAGRLVRTERGFDLASDAPLDLPPTVQALIATRIDALDGGARGALQLAALAGPTFSEALLADAAGLDDPAPLVQELASHGLVVRVQSDGGRASTRGLWRMSSEWVREAAMRGILGVQRRDYHRLLANALERRDDVAERADELMVHCAEGGRLVDAARYAFRAGQAREATQELEEARRIYEAGLDYLRRAQRGTEDWDARVQGEATLQLRLGAVRILLGETAQGHRDVQVALDVANDAGLPWLEIPAHVELGRSYQQRGQIQLARAHLDQAHALLRVHEDAAMELAALEASASLAFDDGRPDDAARLWRQALSASSDPTATARCQLGLATGYLRSEDPERARPLIEAALKKARSAGDRILEGRALNNIGLLHTIDGKLDEALACYRSALELRQSIGYSRGVAVNEHNIGDIHLRRGDPAKALTAFVRSRDVARQIGWTRGEVFNDVYLAYLDADDPQAIEAATARARALGDVETEAVGTWLLGRWLAEHGVDDARRVLDHAEQLALRAGLRPLLDDVRRNALTVTGPG